MVVYFDIGSRVEVCIAGGHDWAIASIIDVEYNDTGKLESIEVDYDSHSTEFDSIIYIKNQPFRPLQPVEAQRVFSKGEMVEFFIDGIWFRGEILKFIGDECKVARVGNRSSNSGRKRKRMRAYTVGLNFIRPPKSWKWVDDSWNEA